MSKILNKIMLIIALIAITNAVLIQSVQAVNSTFPQIEYRQDSAEGTTQADSVGDVFTGADGFITKGEKNQDNAGTFSEKSLKKMSNSLFNILLTIGIVVAVIIGAYIGLQLIVGSVEQKAKVKETLVPYVVGCIIIGGAFTIWKLVITILQGI